MHYIPISLLILFTCLLSAKAEDTPLLFGYNEFKHDSFKPLPQWQRILIAMDTEKNELKSCDADVRLCSSSKMAAWRSKLAAQQGRSRDIAIMNVNQFANAFQPVDDKQNWQKQDYWASPVEFIQKSGDSEDFAIFKFSSLREIGIQNEDMRIVIVKDALRNTEHAVVAIYQNSDITILDNIYDNPRSHSKLSQYIPVYSMNETNRWIHIPQTRNQEQ